jgi:hypothetical protein
MSIFLLSEPGLRAAGASNGPKSAANHHLHREHVLVDNGPVNAH